ncbi:MAG: penicillin-binding protein 2 [Actinobacteria bacterium]|nr:penicillin-binding protein 2 [Actinomycetota bacterium]
MDRQIRRLGAALLVLFLALFVQVNYLQVFAADKLANHPGNAKRLLIAEYKVDRGDIRARDDRTILAKSVPGPGDFRYQRQYPGRGLYGAITGYYSIVSGRSGLEQSMNEYLSGRAEELVPSKFLDEIRGRDRQGAAVVTTISARLQQVAAQALGDRRGGVAAIDPKTGEVLVLVSNPSYDPNPLASHDPGEARRAFEALEPRSAHTPLLSIAAQQLFPPGSTFKIVTAAAALENNIRPEDRFPNPPELDLPQTDETLENFGGEHCLGGAPEISLAQALQISCNVVFGEIGLRVGAEKLVEEAERFGFNRDVPSAINFAEGSIPAAEEFAQDLPGVAISAIGQKSVGANPLQMALVGGAVGNGGTMMEPQFVREIRAPSGRILRSFNPQTYGEALSADNAAALTEMMIAVVREGTATSAQIPGVEVAGKTGTAQIGEGRAPHAWFVAFAPARDPVIAIAVVVLDGGDLGNEATGGAVAAPIAKAVMEAALGGEV